MRRELHIERATKRAVETIEVLIPDHFSKGDTVAMCRRWDVFKKWLLQPLPIASRPRRTKRL